MLGRTTQLAAQLRQVAPEAKLTSMLIQYAQIHLQVRRQRFQPKAITRQLQIQLTPCPAGNRLAHADAGVHAAIRPVVQKGRREIGQGPEPVTQARRQRLGQRHHLLAPQPRHQPIDLRRADLVQRDQRQGERDAIAMTAGLMPVFHRQGASGHLQLMRKLRRGDPGRLVAHEIFFV